MNKITCFSFASALLVTTGLLSACVPQQDEIGQLQARIAQQEQQLRQMNMQISGVQPAQADTWAQVQQLRQEMATMRGQLDDFNNASAAVGGLSGLVGKLERHQQALQAVETQFALDLDLDTLAIPNVNAALGEALSSASSAGSGISGFVAGTGVTLPSGAAALAENVTDNVLQHATNQVSTKDIATILYDTGVAAFNTRNYQEALNAFTDFTNIYPTHTLIGDAWFWQGESQFALKNFPSAVLAYEKVISEHTKSEKTPTAYLKQGISFLETGNKDAGTVRLKELIQKFPKTPEAARANQVLKDQA